MSTTRDEEFFVPYGRAALTALGIAALSAVLAGCSGEPAPDCAAAAQCVRIVEQRDGLAEDGEAEFYVVRITNSCEAETDIKLCFEDNRLTADCRERTAVAPGATIRETKELRFFGDRLKLFSRHTDNAVSCRFPGTDTVRF